MEPRLVPINGLIALITGDGGWPQPFSDAGYRIHGIEALVVPAAKRRVVIDVLLAHDDTGTVVLSECKGGQNLRERQMETYGQVTPTHVAQQVGLPFRVTGVEVMVTGLMDHRDRIRTAMVALRLDLPLLLIGSDEARMEGDLAGVTTFSVALPGPPPRIIVIDDVSSDEELVRHLLPGLIAAAARGESIVGIEALLQGVIPWWALYHHLGGKKRLCVRATSAMRAAIDNNFPKDFVVEHRSGQDCGVIRILKTPAANPPRGVTQGWQRLQRQAERALGRRRRKPESPGQTEAFSFEELGLEAEMPGDTS